MFIISLNYKVSIKEVEQYLSDHVRYLEEQYSLGNFIASGRKVPRTGGVILSNLKDRNLVESIIAEDPFKINAVADYEVIEFVPSMTSEEFEILKS